jgi:O-antigen ligase
MIVLGGIVGACLWAAMLFFFLADALSERRRAAVGRTPSAATVQQTASGFRKGSDIAEPGMMVSGVAGSVATYSSRDSSLRSAA